MKLYWYQSTNPVKVRMALLELGLPAEHVYVDLATGEHRSRAFQAISPRGLVPVLELDSGTRLFESTAILSYLGHSTGKLFPAVGDDARYATALSLLHMEAAAFQTHAGVFFFNRGILPRIGREPDEARMDKARPKLEKLLAVLEQVLGESDYLLGSFSLVDCAFAPYLPYLDLEHRPTLHAYGQRVMARPSFKASHER